MSLDRFHQILEFNPCKNTDADCWQDIMDNNDDAGDSSDNWDDEM